MNAQAVYELSQGSVPLLVSMPHIGTAIPDELKAHYVPRALQTEDADWHLDKVYDFLDALGVSCIKPHYARYVIDLNRPPNDTPMYAGANNTELCPTRFFTGEPLYNAEDNPSIEQISSRIAQYWIPYHDALRTELSRLKASHGYALLWDAHSIQAELPWLFEGRLPDLNIGTVDGKAAEDGLAKAVMKACAAHKGYTHVLNGRFKGGYITRHYGQPDDHVHAVQMEMCQHLYMQDAVPFELIEARAAQVRPVLRDCLMAMLQWGRQRYGA